MHSERAVDKADLRLDQKAGGQNGRGEEGKRGSKSRMAASGAAVSTSHPSSRWIEHSGELEPDFSSTMKTCVSCGCM